MLRLEKTTASGPAHVTAREHARLLTPTFLQALALAFCLHLFGFLLFHVQPFRINQTNTLFPPVQVNIEIALPDSAIFADLEMENLRQAIVPEPAWPEPLIPRLSLNSPDHNDVFAIERPFPKTPITIDSQEELISEWVSLEPTVPSIPKTPRVNLYGPLAGRTLLPGTLPPPAFPSRKETTERLVYAVKVDDHTGKVFWSVPDVGGKLNEQAETILNNLRFEPLAGGFVTEGQIEFVISGGVK